MDDVAELTQPGTDPRASDLVVACEDVWRSIQAQHPDLPPVVMLLGTGVERGRLIKLGHWSEGRWLADGALRGEVLLAGEALHLPPDAVFEVLLHEAAHGLNAVRCIKDTSRGGRYHNARFKRAAIEVGLDVNQTNLYGFASTTIGSDTAERYGADIERLANAMRIARRIPRSALTEQPIGPDHGNGNGRTDQQVDGSDRPKVRPAECGCGRRMRMAPSVLEKGPVFCGNCGSEFTTDRTAQQTPPDTRPAPLLGPSQQDHDQTAADAATRLLNDAARADDGLDVVLRIGRWRAGFGTDTEQRIPVEDEWDRAMWDRLARAVLTVDGRLHGLTLDLGHGMEVRVGDRLVVRPRLGDTDHLPEPDTPGVVTDVRIAEGLVMVDFATAGLYAVGPGTPAASLLQYDYCEPAPPTPTANASGPDHERSSGAGADLGVEL